MAAASVEKKIEISRIGFLAKKMEKRWEQKCCVSAGKKSADPDLGV